MADILLGIPAYGATLVPEIRESRVFEAKPGRLELLNAPGSVLSDNFDDNIFDSANLEIRKNSNDGGNGYGIWEVNNTYAVNETGKEIKVSGAGPGLGVWQGNAVIKKAPVDFTKNQTWRIKAKLVNNCYAMLGLGLWVDSNNYITAQMVNAASTAIEFNKKVAGVYTYSDIQFPFSRNIFYQLEACWNGLNKIFDFYVDGVLKTSVWFNNAPATACYLGFFCNGRFSSEIMDARFDDFQIDGYFTTSPAVTLKKIGAGAGVKFRPLGSGLWIPENIEITGGQAPKYQYALLAGYNDMPVYNGTWLPQAQLRTAIGERTNTVEAIMLQAQFPSDGSVGCSVDDGVIPVEVATGVIITDEGVMA